MKGKDPELRQHQSYRPGVGNKAPPVLDLGTEGTRPCAIIRRSPPVLGQLVDGRLWAARSGPIPPPTSLVYGELRRAIARVSGAATPVALEAPTTDGYTSF
jgi:hypothetical protein